MRITLKKAVRRDGRIEEFDVRQIKKALNRLGYYMPFEDTGITAIPDSEMFDGLRAFQRDMELPVTGEARPK